MKKEKSFRDYLAGIPFYARLGLIAAAVSFLLLIGPLSASSDGEAYTPTQEESLAELCSSVEGVGRCRVMIVNDGEGRVSAVAVLCDGADRVGVRSSLIELICSLYGIGSHRISVLKISD